jgi:hypothetical protein
MGEKTKNILILIAYFLFATAFLGSMGVWLPIAIDNFSTDYLTEETFKSLASNILTYALAIFLIAAIDRIIHLLFKTSKYSNNVLEFFAILFVCLATAIPVFYSLKALKNSLFPFAIYSSIWVAVISWIAWFYVKLQGSKANNFSPIGGAI